MSDIFADTGYWIALLMLDDPFHKVAMEVGDSLPRPKRLITSELVLVELLNFVSGIDAMLRRDASMLWREMHGKPFFDIVPTSLGLLEAAHVMYDKYNDKRWSLTDCASFAIMRERKIADALTADHHFEQAGFRILLK